MKRNILTILSLVFVFTIVNTNAQKQTPPAGGTPKDFKLPEKQVTTLANGLRSTLVHYGALPKVDIQLIIKTGNLHGAANEVWLADLTCQLMKEGTTTMNFKTISKKVAAMGGEINISNGMDNVNISGSVLSEFAPELIKVIGDIVINPAFPATELERLKSDLKRELTVQKSVPQSQATEKFFQIIYKDHPYGRYFPTEAMISSYTLEKARQQLSELDIPGFRKLWRATTILGILFLAGQFVVWLQLAASGLYIATNQAASFLYVFTAAHAVHLLGGIAGLLYVGFHDFEKGKISRVTAVKITSYYWHFMDGLWIFLLLLLYLGA